MKKTYEALEIEIIEFDTEDVIRTSLINDVADQDYSTP